MVLYWADNGGESGTPAGHWLSIASQMVAEKHLSGEQAAWLMARDGRVARRRVHRGVGLQVQVQRHPPAHVHPRDDGLRVGADDPDAALPRVSLRATRRSPAPPRGRSRALLGAVPFEDSTSITLGHAVRKFSSFRAAADEAGMSRIYGGIHYPVSNVEGGNLGRCVAEKVSAKFGPK